MLLQRHALRVPREHTIERVVDRVLDQLPHVEVVHAFAGVRDQLVLVVGPGHRWWSREHVLAQEVTYTPWLMRESGSGTREAFFDALRQAGIDDKAVTVRLTLPSGAAIRAALAEGTCAAIVSRHVVADALKAGRLHAPRFDLPHRHFVLIRHLDRTPGAAERAFTQYLAKWEE